MPAALLRHGRALNTVSESLVVHLSFRSTRGMPFYLKRRYTWFVNYGRSVKTRLRCATSALEIDNGRRSGVISRDDRLCPCCPLVSAFAQ